MSNLTTPPSSTSTNPLPEAWVRKLLHQMLLSYGKRFTDQWGATETGELVAHWASGLGGYSGAELAGGLAALDSREWPPTLPEFKKMCRPPVDTLAAYHEAIAGLEARRRGEAGTWSHPAIYWAAALMRKDLESSGHAQVKGRWSAALAAQLKAGAWAAIPPPRPLIAPRGLGKVDREKGLRNLRALCAGGIAGACSDAPRAWAGRILEREERGDTTLIPIQVRFAREAMNITADKTARMPSMKLF